MMNNYGYGMGIGGWILMALGVIAIWALVVALAVAARGPAQRSQPSAPGPENHAERVLAERFARGDIDSDEYERRLTTLRGARL
jgi:putative membrane protein